MAGGREYDPSKLKELTIYVADRSVTDARFGKTKLNKILFFADFTAYQELGASITGADYQRLERGPAPHQMPVILSALRCDDDIVIRGEQTFGGIQVRVVPTRDADLDKFSAAEISIVDRVIASLRDLTNTEVSELSHDTVAWRVTDDLQVIPYGAALLAAEPPTEDDVLWLEEVAARYATVGTT